MMFQDVALMFTKMGLKEKDAAVYLVCLHFKEGLYVHEITKKTKIKRSTVDVILERLIYEGYISKIKVGNRYKYFAQNPESILFKQEEILENFRAILPALSRLSGQKGETEIRFFEGKKGIREIHDDILLRLKFSEGREREIVSFVSATDTRKIFPDMQSRFVDKRVKMGVWFKGITPQSSANVFEYKNDPEYLRVVKHVDDKKFPFKATFETYADSIMIYSPTKPFGGVVIRNHKIADSMRSLFYLVWDLLPEDT